MLTLERGLPPSLHEFLNELKQIYTMELVHAKCKPVFQHEYALSNLKAKGYKLAVASNSIRNTVEVMMQKANLLQYFDLMMSNQDVTKGKPDPEMYEKSVCRLDCKPEDCLIIEDNDNGIRAAKAAGGHVLVVKNVHDVTLDNIVARIQQIEGAA
jgi:HAD superfamily hydrolase (TIGR01509 family)